jgi:putative ABC transport system substrate-binding protein
MRRREFICLLSGAAAWPIAARGQRPDRLRRLGVLHQYAATDPEGQRRYAAFVQGLEGLGWTADRNVTFEIRYAGGKFERLPILVAELLDANPDVIVTAGTEPVEALRKATKTVPIVMATIGDPVGAGIVASLARPGGNVTGLSNLATELSAKRLDLTSEILPSLARVAVLWNPNNASATLKVKEIEAAARMKGIQIQGLPARRPSDVDEGFQLAAQSGAEALFLADDGFLASQRSRIVELALRYRLPVNSEFRMFADAGGLLSYGPNQIEMWRRAASYVDKIFKGANPAEIAVEQPTQFELVINLKTAKGHGLTVPPSVLARADEVIE